MRLMLCFLQWFGDLVTMQWWSDLWLKEGFADYIERVAVNHFYPQWNKLTSFYIEKTRRALDLDELSTSHPIHVAVKNPTDFSSIYDDITYSKVS